METLKKALGEELFKQVEAAINAHNGADENKETQVKLANLAAGDYVGKGKYDALNDTLTGKQQELDTANKLIEDLRKATKGNEDAQGKIANYETQVQQLQQQLAETKVNAALKVALLSEKALDVDYLSYKLRTQLAAEDKKLELDDNDNLKGCADIIQALKTQFPAQFESTGKNKVDENKLPGTDGGSSLSRADIMRMPYADRAKLYADDPEGYAAAMKN